MWKRIKRALNSQVGRFRDDPFADRDSPDLRELTDNLDIVRRQVTLLRQDLQRLEGEEAELGAKIKAALDRERRDVALSHAATLKRVREDKGRVQRQLVSAQRVCEKAEGVQLAYEQEQSALSQAADDTLARIEASMSSHGESLDRVPKTLGGTTGAQPVSKTIGSDSGPQPKAPASGPGGRSMAKTIGPEPEESPPVEASAVSPDKFLEELERLGRLKEQGILSQSEFEQAKRRLLGT